jgi:hypothetical protein
LHKHFYWFFATYAMIFSFSISTKLSSFYVPTFLKSNPSKQQSSQDLVHYLTKNRCRTEGREYWAEHHCIVGFARSNFLSGLCLAWPTISYVCPLLFHRLFVCMYTSLTGSLLETTQLTVYSRYATSSFRFWCFRLDRDFSLQKNALVFWMIRTWKNGLIFGRTYQNLLLFEKWIRFWKMRSVSVEMDLFLEEMD